MYVSSDEALARAKQKRGGNKMNTLRNGKLFESRKWNGITYLIFANQDGSADCIVTEYGTNYGAWFSFEAFQKASKLKGLLTLELWPVDKIEIRLNRNASPETSFGEQ